jgi:Pyruvate/2-oxoacid:ferredoxin oxidoreductase gamma subunit
MMEIRFHSKGGEGAVIGGKILGVAHAHTIPQE